MVRAWRGGRGSRARVLVGEGRVDVGGFDVFLEFLEGGGRVSGRGGGREEGRFW